MSAPFTTLSGFGSLISDLPQPDTGAIAAAKARDAVLTKPPGALGRLEEMALWLAGWQGTATPSIARPQVIVFAGNHGVTAQGISAFPPEVTVQMVANFESGGAAINQLSKLAGADMSVVALDLGRPTADFSEGPAMSEAETVAALAAGWSAVDANADVLVVGEMGIGNTTSAAAIAAALTDTPGADWAGRGTGLDDAGVAHKASVIDRGLAVNGARAPLDVLASLGGREIAAMVGAMAAARQHRIPVLLDGFIASSAALVLHKANSDALAHVLAAHLSAEGAHQRLLAEMELEPLLSLGLRLGEGSGAALALNILRAAAQCHSDMATFAEAGVSEKGA
ncbi:MAG: nicotinate-nucleotide--dimethylbenzimidazole phosphoribosyltransferase [Pseudomonadota bacterium]